VSMEIVHEFTSYYGPRDHDSESGMSYSLFSQTDASWALTLFTVH